MEDISNKIESNAQFQFKIKNGEISIDCSKLINGDMEHIEYASKNYLTYKEEQLNMTCDAINSRGFGHATIRSRIERKYSLAYARNIYTSYEIIELILLAQYSKNNHYCYTVDSKHPELLEKMKQLEKCLPNVYVSENQYDFQSGGKYSSIGHFDCMKLLLNKRWNYMFILQNDDIAIKTNQQVLEILEAMDFPLDMAFHNQKKLIDSRFNHDYSWTYKDLNIFLEGDKRKENKSIINRNIEFHKGLVPCGMRYETVEYLAKKINITTFLNQLNTDLYGHDELTWQTLLADDILNIPGGISSKCIYIYHPRFAYLSRKVTWNSKDCATNMTHHLVCTWNVQILRLIGNYKGFHGYRFRGEQDFGAFKCWVNYMYHKNNFMVHENLNLWFYYNLQPSILQRKIMVKDLKSIESCSL
uniref:Glycosyltransferase family 92 protein n=1 Tax=Strongyloides papillosus TaxID=174720 RepID=A0A0N5BIR2_STREA